MSMSTIIRHPSTGETHLITGETPGWAHCDAWSPATEVLPSDTPVSCGRCAAMNDRDT